MEGRSSSRMIHGIATTPTISSNGQSLLSEGMMVRLPVPVLFAHSKYGKGIGEVVYLRKSRSEIYVRAVINNNLAGDYAWSFIKSGEARCFSVAVQQNDYRLQAEVDDVKFFDRWTLKEVSVCREGANPDCHFEIFEKGATWPFR